VKSIGRLSGQQGGLQQIYQQQKKTGKIVGLLLNGAGDLVTKDKVVSRLRY